MPASTAAPTGTYKRKDVEAAAVEAGISQRYVALALSELADPAAPTRAAPTRGETALSRTLLGPVPATLSAVRVLRHPPRKVLTAMGAILRQAPWALLLRGTTGGHPLDGGVMLFEIPGMDGPGMSVNPKWTYLRWGVYAKELRFTLRAVGDGQATELTVWADGRGGVTGNLWGAGGTAVGIGAGGIGIGTAIGLKGLALSGALLAVPITLVCGAFAGAGWWGYRAYFQHCLRRAQRELENALEAVELGVDSDAVFGSPPPPPPPMGRSGDDGSAIASILGAM
jgi:hypothetical protein